MTYKTLVSYARKHSVTVERCGRKIEVYTTGDEVAVCDTVGEAFSEVSSFIPERQSEFSQE